MEFEWAEKNASNVRKHKIDFSYAITLFKHNSVKIEDKRKDYGEVRMKVYGKTDTGEEICLVYTVRNGIIRVINARPVNKHERRKYYTYEVK